MVKCELHGSRLELEFIVTGSARFKVSPAALGFSSSSGPDTAPGTSSAASAPGTVPSTKSLPTAFGRSSNADTTAAADQQEDAAQQGGMLQRRTHSAPSAVLQFAAFDAVGDAGDAAGAAAAMNLDAAPAQMAAGSAGATAADTAAAADPADEGAVQQLQQHVDPAMRRAASMHVYPLVSTGQPQVELGSTPPAGSSNTLRWSPHRLSSSSGSPAPSSSRSRNYVRSFGTSMIEGASRSVSSSISNFRLVKTDDGEYWVCVESFTLQFRCAAGCQWAAAMNHKSCKMPPGLCVAASGWLLNSGEMLQWWCLAAGYNCWKYEWVYVVGCFSCATWQWVAGTAQVSCNIPCCLCRPAIALMLHHAHTHHSQHACLLAMETVDPPIVAPPRPCSFLLNVASTQAVCFFPADGRDSAMCQLAASLLRSGRSSMRIALDWLKQGLPFTPGFAVTHITELSSSRTGGWVHRHACTTHASTAHACAVTCLQSCIHTVAVTS